MRRKRRKRRKKIDQRTIKIYLAIIVGSMLLAFIINFATNEASFWAQNVEETIFEEAKKIYVKEAIKEAKKSDNAHLKDKYKKLDADTRKRLKKEYGDYLK